MRNKPYGYIKCAHCGQVGMPLTKTKDDEYICGRQDVCLIRQRAISRQGSVCSAWSCAEKPTRSCSCGLDLCLIHSTMYGHKGHGQEVIK